MTIVGAIRWDAWYGNEAETPGRSVSRTLSPNEYHARAPFWTTEVATNLLEWSPTQTTMDQEIAFAAAGGIDYWAFLLYPRATLPSMMIGFDLYQASADKADVKWAMIRQDTDMGTTGNYATQVAEMVAYCQQSNYQKVLTTRPLVYILDAGGIAANFGGSNANFKAAIDAFRSAAQSAGLGDPYVCLLQYTTALRVTLAADAQSYYALSGQSAPKQPYTTLDSYLRTVWAALAVSVGKTIPLCEAGWDQSPRRFRPVPWEIASVRPGFGTDRRTLAPTNPELVAHVQAGLDYVAANPSVCDADTLLIYAWNEFDEGGWLCPTLGDPTGSRLTALSAILA